MDSMTDFTHAGGIVYRKCNGAVLYLIVTAKGNPDQWVFPKGHIQPGETPEKTAIREVSEETGVNGRIVQAVGTSQFRTDSESIRALFYLMEYEKDAGKKENRNQCWCSYEEGLNLLTFQDARRLLTLVHERFLKLDNNSANKRDDAKELLLTDLKILDDSFWKNEEIGEKRVTFLITLVTALLTFLGALVKTEFSPPWQIKVFAIVALLIIGVITLFRIIKRNRVTDGYKKDMNAIRKIFKEHFDQGKCLVDYHPFGKTGAPGTLNLRKFGGLAHTVAAINSLIFTALVCLILWEEKLLMVRDYGLLIGALVAFIITYGLQHIFISKQEELAKAEIK